MNLNIFIKTIKNGSGKVATYFKPTIEIPTSRPIDF